MLKIRSEDMKVLKDKMNFDTPISKIATVV